MTNLDRLKSLLEASRRAMNWDDGAVAAAILTEFGIDPEGEVITPEEVAVHESAAEDVAAQAKASRERLAAQTPEPVRSARGKSETKPVPAAMTTAAFEGKE